MPYKSKRTGKWAAKVRRAGKTYWLGETFDTKRQAANAETLKRAELEHARPGRDIQVTCDTFAARWTTDYPRPKDSTNRHNAERVGLFADEFAGVQLRDITRPVARQWALKHPDRLPAVRAMFTDARNDGLIAENPFAGLRVPRASKGRGGSNIQVLTERELHDLADRALDVHGDYGPEFRAIVLTAAYVGCRPGELMLIRRGDIDGDLLTITRQLNKYGQVTSPKNGRSRVVVFPPPAQEAIRAIGHRHSDTLFLSKQGRRLSHGTLFYAWNTLRNVAGYPGLDFYEATRHYCATWLLDHGVSHADVAVQLGHTDGGALVMSTYGHPSHDDARRRILGAFGGVTGSNVLPLRKVTEG